MTHKILEYIDRETESPPEDTYSHGCFKVSNPIPTRSFIGDKRELIYTSYQVTDNGDSIISIATPEARALYSGLVKFEDDELRIMLSRLHLGRLRELDAEVGIYQLFQALLELTGSSLLESPYDDTGFIGILRESEIFDPRSLYDFIGDIPYDMVKATHEKSDNLIKRTVKINKPKLEGFDREKIKRLFVLDPLASGVTQGAVLEYLLEDLKNVEKVVFLAPYASLSGSLALINLCYDMGIQCSIGCFGGSLNSDELKYYSPLPHNEPHRMADERDLELHRELVGEMGDTIGVGGNWTANFFAPEVALDDLREYLDIHDLTLDDLIEMAPNLDRAGEIYDGKIEEIIPFSTFYEAKRLGKEDLVEELLRKDKNGETQ